MGKGSESLLERKGPSPQQKRQENKREENVHDLVGTTRISVIKEGVQVVAMLVQRQKKSELVAEAMASIRPTRFLQKEISLKKLKRLFCKNLVRLIKNITATMSSVIKEDITFLFVKYYLTPETE